MNKIFWVLNNQSISLKYLKKILRFKNIILAYIDNYNIYWIFYKINVDEINFIFVIILNFSNAKYIILQKQYFYDSEKKIIGCVRYQS